MSFQATAWAMAQTCGGSLAKLVLLALSDHHNRDTDMCCPRIKVLAEETEMSERSVHKQLALLRDRGLISWEQQVGADGSLRPSQYRLLMRAAPPLVHDVQGGGARGAPGVVHQVQEGPAAGAPGVVHEVQGGGARGAEQEEPGSRTRKLNQEGESENPAPPAAPRPNGQGTRLPEGFAPTPQMLAWVREHCPGLPASEHDRFCDHWRAQPGAKGRKADWPATWRNWMRRAHDDRTARMTDHRPTPGAARVAAARDREARWREMDAAAEQRPHHLTAIGGSR